MASSDTSLLEDREVAIIKQPSMLMFKASSYLLKTIGAVCIVAFAPFVFHMNELTQSQNFIQKFMNESAISNYNRSLTRAEVKLAFGLLTATHYIFAFPGIFMGRVLTDKIGRKSLLFGINGLFDISSSVCMLLARTLDRFELLYAGRFFFGIEWGSHMVALSMYISEISPPAFRGLASSLTMVCAQFFLTCCYICGLPEVFNTESLWHYQFGIPICFAVFQYVGWWFAPESPKYLYINKKKIKEARIVLAKLYGKFGSIEQAEKQIKGEAEQCSRKLGLLTIIRDPALRTTLFLACCLASARCTCGGIVLNQYAFILYTTELGYTPDVANRINVVMSVVLIAGAMLGVALIDKAGRRPLALFGLFGNSLLAVIYVITTTMYDRTGTAALLYSSMACILLMQLMFPVALTMVTYYTISEISTQVARPAISSAATATGTSVRIIYFFIFPILQVAAGVYTTIILISVPSIAIAVYLAIEMPETKKRPVDEVVNMIIRKKSSQVLKLSTLNEVRDARLQTC